MTVYYKMRQMLLQNATAILLQNVTGLLLENTTVITKCDDFVTKCDSCYKMRRLLQIATEHTDFDSLQFTQKKLILKYIHLPKTFTYL